MKKIRDYLIFIPSIVVIVAVVAALFTYDNVDLDSAMARISNVSTVLSSVKAAKDVSVTVATGDAYEAASTKKSAIRIGRKKNKAKVSKTVVPAAPVVKKKITVKSSSGYKDGTYTGSGTGYSGGTTTATVTIKGGKITAVSFTDQDTAQFFDKAVAILKPAILSNGSKSVDTVSGATYSSNGIIESVNNALKKASNGKTVKTVRKSQKKKSTTKKKNKENNSTKPDETYLLDLNTYIPGTYKGSAMCGPDSKMPLWDQYSVELSITIGEDGALTVSAPEGIDGYVAEDDEMYLKKASNGMLPELTSKDFFDKNTEIITSDDETVTADVDTISGATFSSKAIRDAFVNAIRQAVQHE